MNVFLTVMKILHNSNYSKAIFIKNIIGVATFTNTFKSPEYKIIKTAMSEPI